MSKEKTAKEELDDMSTKTVAPTKTAEQELEDALNDAEANQAVINDDDFLGEVEVVEQDKLSAGIYEVEIVDISKELTKAKPDKPSRPMIVWEFKILGPTNKGFKFKSWVLLDEFNWNNKNIALAVGLSPSRTYVDDNKKTVEVFKLQKSDLLNKLITVEVEVSTNDDGMTNVKVKKYIKMEDARKNFHLGI